MSVERKILPHQLIKVHSTISPWKSLSLILCIYLSIIVLAFLGGRYSGWKLAPLSLLLIAGLQNHLLILLHEGSHFLLHPSRKINDLIADLSCAIPLFTLQRNYRVFHLDHHRHTGDPEKDPEVAMYNSMGHDYKKRNKLDVFKIFVMDFSGVNTLKFIKWNLDFCKAKSKEGKLQAFGPYDLLLNAIVWAPLLAASFYFDLWAYLLFFWILPYFFLAIPFMKIHGYGEHNGVHSSSEFKKTLTHLFNPITNFFIYPIRSGLHLEHHLYPSIPWYHMKSFRDKAHSTSEEYARKSKELTVDGVIWGKSTILEKVFYRN